MVRFLLSSSTDDTKPLSQWNTEKRVRPTASEYLDSSFAVVCVLRLDYRRSKLMIPIILKT